MYSKFKSGTSWISNLQCFVAKDFLFSYLGPCDHVFYRSRSLLYKPIISEVSVSDTSDIFVAQVYRTLAFVSC